MLRMKRLFAVSPVKSRCFLRGDDNVLRIRNPYQLISNRFLDIYELTNKEAIAKERARIKDEMSRGYFADLKEMEKHGGKISLANKIIIPAVAAVKFPAIEVNRADGSTIKLPVMPDENGSKKSQPDVPKVSLLGLSFRASSVPMIDSWSKPFLNTFGHSSDVHLYEVSFIDSWLLRRSLVKKLLLKVMKKPKPEDQHHILQKQNVYFFGDHYFIRKDLRVLNLLTGYVFLLDKFGRIRWQGSGTATEGEASSLMSCTSLLLDEN